ncbi:hypothetical protein HOK51_10130 [Candidatus Woesearchaeota archaeon]|jgi:hypothetical protein|nr:hypothetical protein [Candidatus Woesearchaeota archaeon]MBT6520182.1 hypothetical protein [Candidatus Woesearchaeota archaeon]MBT7367192.1 hypothetical protein [Candidatus Woesearchaeota archaeon]
MKFKRFISSSDGQMTMDVLKTLIIGVIILLLLIGFVMMLRNPTDNLLAQNKCHASVLTHAKLVNIGLADNVDNANIECPTRYITLEERDQKKLMRQIADEMYLCWNNFGEGKVKLFKATDEKFCAVCSVIDFEKKDLQIPGFTSFLQQEKIPVKIEGKRISYSDYITGVQTSPQVIDQTKVADINYLDSSLKYAVLFTYYKESYWSKVKSAVWGAFIGVVTTATIFVAAGFIIGVTGGAGTPIVAIVLSNAAYIGGTAAGAAVGAGVGASASDGEALSHGADWQARLIFTKWQGEDIAKLECNSLQGKGEGKYD